LKPYRWERAGQQLTEIPVTTMPIFKVPIHASYVLFLAGFSTFLAKSYFRTALWLCRRFGVGPSLLLHPLDFMGVEDKTGLDFFPAMRAPYAPKCELMGWLLDQMQRHYRVVPMAEHAAAVPVHARVLAVPAETPATVNPTHQPMPIPG
jgi:peptidoglycan-N-acetylglucosamine deacetylase